MRLFRKLSVVGALGVLSLGGTANSQTQTNLNQNPQSQGANVGANGGVNAQAGAVGTINRTPWFSNPTIRRQLQLNDEQFNQLNKAYTQSWAPYNQGYSALDKSLAENERQQRAQALHDSFNKDFSKAIDGVLTDKAARQRYNQMDWQYRGYGAFSDPAVQSQLKLNDEQRQKFEAYNNEWNQQMNIWQREYANDRDGVNSRFRDARKEFQNRIDSTLTPDQRTMWKDMSGKPFDLPAEVYFQSDANSNTSLKPVVK